MIFLSTTDVLRIHEKQIQLFGGSHGVRDMNLLDSAVSIPASSFNNGFLHPTIFLMAAAYLFHISKNHPFIDGNKRTAFVCMDVFLRVNGYIIKASEEDLENLVIATVTGKESKNSIADFLKQNTQKQLL